MQYKTLGKRTGLKVSALGFGAMRLPMKGKNVDRDKATPMIHRAFELGVNYIDSAVFYCDGDSQPAVGEALKGWRDKVVVSTKNHSYRKSDYDVWRKNLEDSLRKLDVESIDIYNLHGINWQSFEEHISPAGGSYEWMAKAKAEGLIKHICFSFHDKPEALIKIAQSGMFDVVTCQYNLLDRANEPAIKVCHDLGMGVVIMGPVGGGRLGAPSAALQKLIPGASSVPEVALRFVIANPNVSVALSGMSTIEHVQENCQVAGRGEALSSQEQKHVKTVLTRYKKLAELYCTGCRYCMPCPSGVDIPWMFSTLNNLRVYGLDQLARDNYKNSSNRASLCLACGQCIPKCPQHIDIVAQLRETVRALDPACGKLTVQLHPGKLQSLAPGKIELRSRLTCANLSDHPVTPAISFQPGKGVEVKLASPVKTLAPFQHGQIPLKVSTSVKPGKPFDLGVKVASELEAVMGATTLNLAIAAPGGAKALAKAMAVSLGQDDPGCKIDQAVAGKHGAKFSMAYDAKSLIIKVVLKDDLAFVPNPARPMHISDRLEMNFDLAGLVKPQGSNMPIFHWRMVVSPPSSDTGVCYIWIPQPGDRNAQGITATPRKSAGGVTITIDIPWEKLECPPGKPGAALGFKIAHVSHSARGKLHSHRHWDTAGGWVVLG